MAVGYITASIKTIQDTEVGDTVTLANNPATEAIQGYRKNDADGLLWTIPMIPQI